MNAVNVCRLKAHALREKPRMLCSLDTFIRYIVECFETSRISNSSINIWPLNYRPVKLIFVLFTYNLLIIKRITNRFYFLTIFKNVYLLKQFTLSIMSLILVKISRSAIIMNYLVEFLFRGIKIMSRLTIIRLQIWQFICKTRESTMCEFYEIPQNKIIKTDILLVLA